MQTKEIWARNIVWNRQTRGLRGLEAFNEWIFDISDLDWRYWEGEGSLWKGKVAILCRKGGSEKKGPEAKG